MMIPIRSHALALIGLAIASLWRNAGGHQLMPSPPSEPIFDGKAFLIESIPRDTILQPIPGTRDTFQVQLEFINEAQQTIDFWAQYWTLVNTTGLSPEQKKRFGTDRGQRIYDALLNAAKRGVQLRIVSEHRLSDIEELEAMQRQYPNQVTFHLWNASEWYEYGMMHLKSWIFDTDRAIITSANTDWRSFTQVNEVGVALQGAPGFQVVKDLQTYFDRWWAWSDPAYRRSLQDPRMQVFDPYLQHTRLVPCFSKVGKRFPGHSGSSCQSPFNSSSSTVYNLENPMPLVWNNTLGNTFLSCSPPEICDTPDAIYSQTRIAPDGRTWDGDALVQTILSARERVSLAAMYYVPSAYTTFLQNPAWWPALNDALLTKVAAGVKVRLMVSQWLGTYPKMHEKLRALQLTAEANAAWAKNPGSIEIRYFAVPGWENATGPSDVYPTYSRVQHAKFIVTDNRFNIGTNEMEWSFFHCTGGTSFNSDHPLLRRQLEQVFDRDWDSGYAKPLFAAESDRTGTS